MLNQHRILRVLQLIAILQKAPSKSIRNLAGLLETTERTTYRYLDLIKTLGFDLQKDALNKYFIIQTTTLPNYDFTEQEIKLLQHLLHTDGKQHKLKHSILSKLHLQNHTILSGTALLHAHLGKIVETIENAIQNGYQICLKEYHSANSNNISDRIVEPIQFTENYTSLAAFEIISRQNKFFNIERITDVCILKKRICHQALHQFNTPDVFGFGEAEQQYTIHLKMTLKAYVIMKEEYPLAIPHIKKQHTDTPSYILKMKVNDFKPITRFVIGLLNDIEVLGSDDFKAHLKEIAGKLNAPQITTLSK